jgi:hypothetical protein
MRGSVYGGRGAGENSSKMRAYAGAGPISVPSIRTYVSVGAGQDRCGGTRSDRVVRRQRRNRGRRARLSKSGDSLDKLRVVDRPASEGAAETDRQPIKILGGCWRHDNERRGYGQASACHRDRSPTRSYAGLRSRRARSSRSTFGYPRPTGSRLPRPLSCSSRRRPSGHRDPRVYSRCEEVPGSARCRAS